eukprot:CCRYP_007305-RA/>CCRYP_007305-RA protein AED:0.00 eAED:0.00 QI:103/1/1/1/0/0/2/93/69
MGHCHQLGSFNHQTNCYLDQLDLESAQLKRLSISSMNTSARRHYICGDCIIIHLKNTTHQTTSWNTMRY